jgi:hypothetical protein
MQERKTSRRAALAGVSGTVAALAGCTTTVETIGGPDARTVAGSFPV